MMKKQLYIRIRGNMFGKIVAGCSLFLMLLLATSCIEREMGVLPGGGTDTQDSIRFRIGMEDVSDVVVTRATSGKECDIYRLDVAIYDNDGNRCFLKRVYDNLDVPIDRASVVTLPKMVGEKYKNCTLFAVANVAIEEGTASSIDGVDLTTLDLVHKAYGQFQVGTTVRVKSLPMCGEVSNFDMTAPSALGSPTLVRMKRLMAKVNFKINVASGKSFSLVKWHVGNLSRYVGITEASLDYADRYTIADPYFPSGRHAELELTNVTTVYSPMKKIETGHSSETVAFFLYENRRGGRGAANPDNLNGYPTSGTPTDPTGIDPRYKSLYAPANAVYLEVGGLYEANDGRTYSLIYRFYLGGNSFDDYNIQRNHEYTYTINIKGVTNDDITVDTYDSRVHKGNSFFVNLPGTSSELSMDAHYTRYGMSVQALNGTGKLELFSDAGCTVPFTGDWIRILPKTTTNTNAYNIGIYPGKEVTSVPEIDFGAPGSDLAVYDYYLLAAENTSDAPRTIYLKTTHTHKLEEQDIVQSDIKKITQYNLNIIDNMGVERLEEYSILTSTADEYPELKSGLQWGYHAVDVPTAQTTTSDGYTATNYLVGLESSYTPFSGVDVNSQYNTYAARYCYNKNKRDADGNVKPEDNVWYLPSVSELEKISGIASTDMAGKTYWSANAPTQEMSVIVPSWANDWFLGWIWNLIKGWFYNADGTYYYTKVSRAAKDGKAVYDEGASNGQRYQAYWVRTKTLGVRCVRKSPNP